jgi:hypothetical protein
LAHPWKSQQSRIENHPFHPFSQHYPSNLIPQQWWVCVMSSLHHSPPHHYTRAMLCPRGHRGCEPYRSQSLPPVGAVGRIRWEKREH